MKIYFILFYILYEQNVILLHLLCTSLIFQYFIFVYRMKYLPLLPQLPTLYEKYEFELQS